MAVKLIYNKLTHINGMLEAVCCILVQVQKYMENLDLEQQKEAQIVIDETLADFITE